MDTKLIIAAAASAAIVVITAVGTFTVSRRESRNSKEIEALKQRLDKVEDNK